MTNLKFVDLDAHSQMVVEKLIVLRQQAVEGTVETSYQGICSNLCELIKSEINSEKFSDLCYDLSYGLIVEATGSAYPLRGYPGHLMWEGDQLKARIKLIDDLIVMLESGEE